MLDRWQVKVGAWIHDPGEKALVLFRDRAGHEGGTVLSLAKELFGGGIPKEIQAIVKKADRWASAADRASFPQIGSGDGAVRFWERPLLVHPMSGDQYDLATLQDVDVEAVKAASLEHFSQLIRRDGEAIDWKSTFLSFWRQGPTLPPGESKLGALWETLPADTRVPDHSIWEHLRLTSALAGAMSQGTPALLVFSIGPVQSFIARARSTSDLWAGSHLLSEMTWTAMRAIAEAVGPDAILFPDLRGVAAVDLWLERRGLETEPNRRRAARSDAHPLFQATIPNRFVAIVASEESDALAEAATHAVRRFAKEQAQATLQRLLKIAGGDSTFGQQQVEHQLAAFPDVHWTAVPWSLIEESPDGRIASVEKLAQALALFQPHGFVEDNRPGFLGSDTFRVLSRELKVGEAQFFAPNPGVLYPALNDLSERVLASLKTVRVFEQLPQHGYRCSICGEREPLARSAEEVSRHALNGSLWAAVAKEKPAWASATERLCAICALKRLWPSLYVDELRSSERVSEDLRRYVVSTHTMALVPTLRQLAELDSSSQEFQQIEALLPTEARAALPRSLVLDETEDRLRRVMRRLPARLDELRDAGDSDGYQTLVHTISKTTGVRPESYYAILLMDGDDMGAWIAGDGARAKRPSYGKLWHPDLAASLISRFGTNPDFKAYMSLAAPPSPAYQGAVSRALNSFSQVLAPAVVERFHAGKVLYAGGDDLMALSSVDDLLSMLVSLRCAYSGVEPPRPVQIERLRLKNGYALLDRRLHRTMGATATASIGAVIAHHMTPLGSVLRELRAAEKKAKNEGKDGFSITLMKRSGGTQSFSAQWQLASADSSTITLLLRARDAFAKDVSRRAAYHLLTWIDGLPDGSDEPDNERYRRLLESTLRYQLLRQSVNGADIAKLERLASDLATFAANKGLLAAGAVADRRSSATTFLAGFINLAEFLAREGRAGPADAALERQRAAKSRTAGGGQ